MTDCVVIGAGLSGLLAAQQLQAAGWRVTVLDKGRGVGGRMATRRIGNGVLDHGAQFFTVRDERFGKLVADWQQMGLVAEWARGFADASGQPHDDGHPRYCGTTGMTAIPKYLAQDLDVQVNIRVKSIEDNEAGWHIITDDGQHFHTGALVLTPPVPQSLALLDAGSVQLPPATRHALDQIAYHPCLAVLALLDQPARIPSPGAVQLDSEPIRWIADNTQKGISPNAQAITIHGAPGFSRDHWDADRTRAGQKLLDAAANWLGDARVTTFQVQGWRYSQPVETYPEPCLVVEGLPPLVFAGDAFAGPRVEGAALSGMAAADALLNQPSG